MDTQASQTYHMRNRTRSDIPTAAHAPTFAENRLFVSQLTAHNECTTILLPTEGHICDISDLTAPRRRISDIHLTHGMCRIDLSTTWNPRPT